MQCCPWPARTKGLWSTHDQMQKTTSLSVDPYVLAEIVFWSIHYRCSWQLDQSRPHILAQIHRRCMLGWTSVSTFFKSESIIPASHHSAWSCLQQIAASMLCSWSGEATVPPVCTPCPSPPLSSPDKPFRGRRRCGLSWVSSCNPSVLFN